MGILQVLIEQSKLPSGVLGKVMLQIMNHAHRELTMLGISKLQSGERALDVSCGGGNAIAMMVQSNKFEQIYGIDFSQEAISMAIQKNKSAVDKGLVTIKQASVLQLPFEDNYFDAATAFQSHYHWPDIIDAMREVYRVLKPGGQFILVSEIYKIEYHMKEYNNAEKTEYLFKDSGFINIQFTSDQKYICVNGYK